MNIRDIDTEKVFGKPAISFIGLQVYYDRYEHKSDPVYLSDAKWFASHPRQRRVVRAARSAEFEHDKAHIDYFGQRISAPQLWVSVERRLGGQQHVVQPVYRGTCFWPVDSADYMLPDDKNDDEGNVTADVLLFQMHQARGSNPAEIQQHAERIAELFLASMSLPSNQKAN